MRRHGFTLIEVMVALVILLGVVLGIAQLTGTMIHTVATSDRRMAAVELAEDRLTQVRLDPSYDNLESLYNGTESSFTGLPGVTRATVIAHTGGGTLTGPDYKKITVTVSGPGLLVPVSRTVTVAAP